MPKRLVVCCDGTWNRPDQIDDGIPAPTNVSKFALAVARQDDAGVAQLMHYVQGVGTGRFDHIRGGAFGVGLSHNVREAYRFIVETYEPGDDLFVLGFSRGAYTARSTVGLVRNSGILLRENRDHADEAFVLYRNRNDRAHPNATDAQMFRRMYCHPDPEIHFVGVWDTVGSLGIPGPQWLTKRWSFHDTTLSSHVRNAFHALAIDERRKPFEPTLWKQQEHAVDQTLEQRWFAGVHCDVGGGYADPALGELALLWMVERARDCGLAFDAEQLAQVTGADPLGEIHDSYKSFYTLLGPYQRPLEADGGAVSDGALTRRDAGIGYDPPALAEYLAAHAVA
jgi:uncharacterized protein (DUF2235 family)